MSLFVPSNGLLETHVSWAEVEARLQKALHTTARLGEKKSVTHIGAGNGFCSRIGVITCDWTGVSEDDHLPDKIALKMSSMLALKEMTQKNYDIPEGIPMEWAMAGSINFIKQSHNVEVAVFEVLMQLEGDLAVPKCYYSVPFSEQNQLEGSLALQFFDSSKVFNVFNNMSLAQVKQIARALGKIQAASVKFGSEKNKCLDHDPWTEYWKVYTNDAFFTQSLGKVKKIDENVLESLQAVIPLIPQYFGSTLAITIHKQIGCGRVLVNGDHWSANVLFDAKGDLASIIDWQLGHLGVGVEDLLRISMSAMSSQDRRQYSSELLNDMFDSMESNLDGAQVPYTRKQLFEMYDLLFPHAAFFFASTITSVCMATVEKPPNEEEQRIRKEIVSDKIRGIFEDILIYHKKNEKSASALKFK